jgi:hypothetical protein
MQLASGADFEEEKDDAKNNDLGEKNDDRYGGAYGAGFLERTG